MDKITTQSNVQYAMYLVLAIVIGITFIGCIAGFFFPFIFAALAVMDFVLIAVFFVLKFYHDEIENM